MRFDRMEKSCFGRERMMKLLHAGVALLLFAGAGFADDMANRAKLSGSWKASASQAKSAEIWVLDEQPNDAIHIRHADSERTLTEFDCNTMGKECKVRVAGKPASVSMWFDGATLVQMETRGSNVTRRKFQVTGGGDSLSIEATPLVPAGKPQVTGFERSEAAAKASR